MPTTIKTKITVMSGVIFNTPFMSGDWYQVFHLLKY